MLENTLYYGDNLDILRRYIESESVDLIYLDPPFNSNRNYSVLFKDESGRAADAQIAAFEDTWHWGHAAEDTYVELVTSGPPQIRKMVEALVENVIGRNQMMAYLVMMAARLVELHRVLKPTGSLYLHCDPTASHYLKVVLDTVFGTQNYKNEIIWKRKTGRGDTGGTSKRFGVMTDVLLFYGKSDDTTFNPLFGESNPEYIEKMFKFADPNGRRYAIDNLASPSPRPNLMYEYRGYKPPSKGWAISREKMEEWDRAGRLHFPSSTDGRIRRKRYLDELEGKPIQNLWDDINAISSQAAERLGYPTQKPLALLERIISASSNPGDVVLDPFAGCGTAIAAAQKLERRWIGIDVTHLAITVQKRQLDRLYGLRSGVDYQVIGEPQDVGSAHALAQQNRHQFEYWAISLVGALPSTVTGTSGGRAQGKKGGDRGIDGEIVFLEPGNKPKRVLVSVKSNDAVNPGMIRDLHGVIDREGAAIGLFITLNEPTSGTETAAFDAGRYTHPSGRQYQRIQILTIADLLAGKKPELPGGRASFAAGERIKSGKAANAKQQAFDFGDDSDDGEDDD